MSNMGMERPPRRQSRTETTDPRNYPGGVFGIGVKQNSLDKTGSQDEDEGEDDEDDVSTCSMIIIIIIIYPAEQSCDTVLSIWSTIWACKSLGHASEKVREILHTA